MLDGPIESLPWFSPRHDAAGENLSRPARNHPNLLPVRPAPPPAARSSPLSAPAPMLRQHDVFREGGQRADEMADEKTTEAESGGGKPPAPNLRSAEGRRTAQRRGTRKDHRQRQRRQAKPEESAVAAEAKPPAAPKREAQSPPAAEGRRHGHERRDPRRPIANRRAAGIGEVIADRRASERRNINRRTRKDRRA